MPIELSILLPTRGRTTALLTSIKSLLDNADSPANIEILLGMDRDDQESYEYVLSEIVSRFSNIRVHKFDRYGYDKLHFYANALAALSQGKWLMLWNDDALMNTKGWDSVVYKYDIHPMPLLRAEITDMDHPFALFPIVKKKWFEIVGTFSGMSHIDRFIYNVQSNIDWNNKHLWVVDVPISITHDRFDITGNNNDETFQNGLKHYVNENIPDDPESDGYLPNFTYIVICCNKLMNWMNKNQGRSFKLHPIEPIVPQHQVVADSHGTNKNV